MDLDRKRYFELAATLTQQPQLASAGVLIVGGPRNRPSVSFTSGKILYITGETISRGVDYVSTYAFAATRDPSTLNQRLLEVSPNTVGNTSLRFSLGSVSAMGVMVGGRNPDDVGNCVVVGGVINASSFITMAGYLEYASRGAYAYLNGVQVAASLNCMTSAGTSASTIPLQQNISNGSFNGWLSELLIYESNQRTYPNSIEAVIQSYY